MDGTYNYVVTISSSLVAIKEASDATLRWLERNTQTPLDIGPA